MANYTGQEYGRTPETCNCVWHDRVLERFAERPVPLIASRPATRTV